MLPEGRHDGTIARQTSRKRDCPPVWELIQVHILLQLASHRVFQRLRALLQRFGMSQHLFQQILLKGHAIRQHHHLSQIQRMRNILILLSSSPQSDEYRQHYDCKQPLTPDYAIHHHTAANLHIIFELYKYTAFLIPIYAASNVSYH